MDYSVCYQSKVTSFCGSSVHKTKDRAISSCEWGNLNYISRCHHWVEPTWYVALRLAAEWLVRKLG